MTAYAKVLTTVILALAVIVPAHAVETIGNLIEYGSGPTADGEFRFPSLAPPIVKIWQDGTVAFVLQSKYMQGQLSSAALQKLKAKLSTNKALKSTGYVPTKKAQYFGFHGGITYIRYLEGESEILLVTDGIPLSGVMKEIIALIEHNLPTTFHPFVPKVLTLKVYYVHYDLTPVPNPPEEWPFQDDYDLTSLHEFTVSDSAKLSFLFPRLNKGLSLYEWDCQVGRDMYGMVVEEAPGWYEKENLGLSIAGLLYDWQMQNKKGTAP